jgi:hypothetical protein
VALHLVQDVSALLGVLVRTDYPVGQQLVDLG